MFGHRIQFEISKVIKANLAIYFNIEMFGCGPLFGNGHAYFSRIH
jgi:hypothetical protein